MRICVKALDFSPHICVSTVLDNSVILPNLYEPINDETLSDLNTQSVLRSKNSLL
jgi:hypothetical protein